MLQASRPLGEPAKGGVLQVGVGQLRQPTGALGGLHTGWVEARMRFQGTYMHLAPKVAMWRVGASRRLWEWPVTCYYQASPQLMTQQYWWVICCWFWHSD